MTELQPAGREMLLIRAPNSRIAERRYVFDVVLSEWLGFDYDLSPEDGNRVAIQLAGDMQRREVTLPDILFATPPEAWLADASSPVRPLARLSRDVLSLPTSSDPEGLPILFGAAESEPRASHETDSGVALTFDVFGSVFYLLTRYEEIVKRDRDAHDRFLASASLAAAEGFLHRPIVDEYVDQLWASMQSVWPTLNRRRTTFRLRLTHDVDQPWATVGQPVSVVMHALAGDLLSRRDVDLASRRARSLLGSRRRRVEQDPYNTFDMLMTTSERHGLRSSFYVLAGNDGGAFDGRYQLSDPPVVDLLRRIHERGHEIGLHASYRSYDSAERTRTEFEALRAACRSLGIDQSTWGVRQHFLRFENPQTWRNHESAGLEHDSTLAFADEIGFRAGTCREYPLFDLLARRRMNLRERPLVVMDTTMLEYMRLDLADAADRARSTVEVCRRHGGDAVLLYHNNLVAGRAQRAQYNDLVAALA